MLVSRQPKESATSLTTLSMSWSRSRIEVILLRGFLHALQVFYKVDRQRANGMCLTDDGAGKRSHWNESSSCDAAQPTGTNTK